MLRSAISTARSVALFHESVPRLSFIQISRILSGNLYRNRSTATTEGGSVSEQGSTEVNEDKCSKTIEEKNRLLQEKEALIKELEDKYKRALAENQNVIQRGRKQVEDARLFGIQGFSKDLLEVADVLEKATQSVPVEDLRQNDSLKTLFEGLQLTESQLIKVFQKNGLQKVSPLGEKFDPHFHEALFQQEFPDKEEGTVAMVSKVGYTLNGRTLRPALVGVVKHKSA